MSESATDPFLHQLHHVAVAWDSSPWALAGFRFAMGLAARAEAEVAALHVVPSLAEAWRRVLFPYAALGADEPAIVAELLDSARSALLDDTAEVRAAYADTPLGDEIYARIAYGDLVPTLRDHIAESNGDLVVCGAFGHRAPTPGLLGSTATGLLANATRPTFVVRDPGSEPRIRRVLVAHDGGPAAPRLINWAVSFALTCGAEDLRIVFAVPDRERDELGLFGTRRGASGGRDGGKGGRGGKKDPNGRATARARELTQRALETLYVPFPREDAAKALSFDLSTPVAEPVRGILGAIDDTQADVVVLSTRSRERRQASRLGSVAFSVARLAPCHVLAVPWELCAPRPQPGESDG